MSTVLSDTERVYSRAEYRSWCENQVRGRFERIDGRIVAMAAERVHHVRIKASVYLALRRAIASAGLPCEALADGMTVETGDSDYEPDALVDCGPRLDGDAVAASNPVIVVEVLSPGTRAVDTTEKLAGYFAVPSILHYLIVHPVKRVVTHHRRMADRIETRLVHSGGIVLDPPGLTVTLEEIYGPPPET